MSNDSGSLAKATATSPAIPARRARNTKPKLRNYRARWSYHTCENFVSLTDSRPFIHDRVLDYSG